VQNTKFLVGSFRLNIVFLKKDIILIDLEVTLLIIIRGPPIIESLGGRGLQPIIYVTGIDST
jgi:hypothetical protein